MIDIVTLKDLGKPNQEKNDNDNEDNDKGE